MKYLSKSRMKFFLVWLFLFEVSFAQQQKFKLPEAVVQQQLNLLGTRGSPKNDFPIVLHHGIIGFWKVFGKGYFNQIASDLRARGFEVYVTHIRPFGSSAERSEELFEQVKDVLQLSGKKSVRIVAHSLGGLDARCLAFKYQSSRLVKSVTTVGSPHRGTPLVHIALKSVKMLKAFYLPLSILILPTSKYHPSYIDRMIASFDQLRPENMANNFNQRVLNSQSTEYFSFGGVVRPGSSHEFGTQVSFIFVAPRTYLYRAGIFKNDGLIGIESTKWGKFIGELDADHLSLVNQHWPSVPVRTKKNFDAKIFYATHIRNISVTH